MTALLVENLPLVASAPNGVKKLRELILQLAMMGKLVPQDPSDEPASELLKRIQNEKVHLIKRGELRKEKPFSDITSEEQVFELPRTWVWARLGEIGDWGAGSTPLRSNPDYYGGSILWFKSGELTCDLIFDSEEKVTELALKECSLRENNVGDVLIAMYGATIGKTAILGSPGTTNQAVCACTPFNGISNQFLLTLLKALKSALIKRGAGAAQPNISREKIIATVIGLPPLAEQHRIVAKVDELMALCDHLDTQQSDAEAAHKQLVKTLLNTLTQSTDQSDFATIWERIKENFNSIFTTESSIDVLKQTLLQLAVMGKLVPQDPSDEPASELLKRTKETKLRLVQSGRLREPKVLPADSTSPADFQLPANWSIASLQDTFDVRDGTHDSPKYLPSGYPLITSKNLYFGNLDTVNVNFISEQDFQKISERSAVSRGDVLFAMIGHSIGNAALVNVDTLFAIKNVALFKSYSPKLSSMHYLLLFLRAKTLDFKASSSGGAQSFISLNKLRTYKIPLPPLAEQHRIVAKVDELMTLCDLLKDTLQKARAQQELVGTVIIEQAISIGGTSKTVENREGVLTAT